nr:TNT domain-containing protein [Lachnospiraceae bacterium]
MKLSHITKIFCLALSASLLISAPASAATVSQVLAEENKKDVSTSKYLPASVSNYKYVHDPMLNPKAAEDIIVNPNAIYGYSPNPASKRLGSFASYDWTDPVTVEKARQDRIKYHRDDARLYDLAASCEKQGLSLQETARQISALRNLIRIQSYDNNPAGLKTLKESNLKTYGNEFGPTADSLYEKYGSWEKVIEKALSSNPGMDACLGLYDDYYLTYVANGQIPGINAADKAKIDAWGSDRPDDLVYLQYKSVYDNPVFYDQTTGEVHYPANNGFWGNSFDHTLSAGIRIECYGNEYGTYAGYENTPYTGYSYAPGSKYDTYSVYEVVKPVNVKCGAAYPWFGEKGG